jgi:hypothetical protein
VKVRLYPARPTPWAYRKACAALWKHRARAETYRARALALYRLGRKKYAAENKWVAFYENTTSVIWTYMDRLNIPRETRVDRGRDAVEVFNSFYGRLEYLAVRIREADERAAKAERDLAHVTGLLHNVVEHAGLTDDTGNGYLYCRSCGDPDKPVRVRPSAYVHESTCAYVAAEIALETSP